MGSMHFKITKLCFKFRILTWLHRLANEKIAAAFLYDKCFTRVHFYQ